MYSRVSWEDVQREIEDQQSEEMLDPIVLEMFTDVLASLELAESEE